MGYGSSTLSVTQETHTPLKAAIEAWGTQRQLARKLDVDQSTVSRWVVRRTPPRDRAMRKRIARILKRQENELWER